MFALRLQHASPLSWTAIILTVTAVTLGSLAAATRARGDTITTRCQRSPSATSCTTLWLPPMDGGPRIIRARPDPSPETAERVARWESYCRPVGRVDPFGVTRLAYAHPGCEFGRSE